MATSAEGTPSPAWRPLTPQDVEQLATLAAAAAAVDDTGAPPEAAILQRMFAAPRFDAATDTFSAWEADRLVAYGAVFLRDEPVEGRALVGLDGAVHPERRGRGLGRELLKLQEGRGAMLAAERLPGVPVRIRAAGNTEGSSAQRLFEAAGYAPDNYFITMEVDLATWRPLAVSADVSTPDAAALAAVRDAHNDAFRDHRNFSPTAKDHWAFFLDSPTTRPELCRVVTEAGRVLAYAVCAEYEPGVVHVDLLGTRREARGRGLGRAVLTEVLRGAEAAGYRSVDLEVDSTSPTAADRLYVSVGFSPVRTISRYVRDL